jgi:hypothetical protein
MFPFMVLKESGLVWSTESMLAACCAWNGLTCANPATNRAR